MTNCLRKDILYVQFKAVIRRKLMNNFVAKHNYNRPSAHKSAKDYTRQKLSANDFDIEPPIMF